MLTKQTCLLISSFLLTVPTSSVAWWPFSSSGSCTEHKGILTILGGTLITLGGYCAWNKWNRSCRRSARVTDLDAAWFDETWEQAQAEERAWQIGYTPCELGSLDPYSLPRTLDSSDSDDDSDSDWSDI